MNYYAILPAEVRYNKKLSPAVKLFYAELTAFADNHSRVAYDPKHFESFFNVDNRTIRRWIEQLKKDKLVYVKEKVLHLTSMQQTHPPAKYFEAIEVDTTVEERCISYWKDMWKDVHVNNRRAIPYLTTLLESYTEDQIKLAMRTRKTMVENDPWFDSKLSLSAMKKDIFQVFKKMSDLLNAASSEKEKGSELKPLFK